MRDRAGRPAVVAAAAVLLAGALILAFLLLRPQRPDVAPSTAAPRTPVASLAPGRAVCQDVGVLAGEGGVVRMALFGGDTRVRVSARAEDGRVLARGTPVPAAGAETAVRLSPRIGPQDGPIEICARNAGAGKVVVGGITFIDTAGRPGRAYAVRVQAAERSSGLARLGTIGERFAAARAGDVGGWLLVGAVLLLLGAGLAAVFLILREALRR
jgi:hypothetical protein